MNEKLNILAGEFLACGIVDLFPNAKIDRLTLTDDGFRYSFWLPKQNKLSSNDFSTIKNKLNELYCKSLNVSYTKKSLNDVKSIFKNNKFKLYQINQSKLKQFNLIKIGDKFIDIIDSNNDKKLPNPNFIKLTNISGVYFDNNAKNEQLIAIDGWAKENNKAYKEYELFLNEKSQRDHRKIGAKLELFCFDKLIGQGLPIWLENGTNIKFEIENYCRELLFKNEYKFVQTPILGSVDLYKISGHWNHYRENMFPVIKVENEQFVLKPMSCPHHITCYKQRPHSYKELPYRIAEFGIQHRYEASGALTGLERVRQMQLVDTHTILMHSQIESEISRLYQIILEAHKTLGTKIYSIDLSLHDPKDKEKFFDNEKMWQNAEKQLEKALKKLNVPYKKVVGEAAFYGPKIDIQMKTVLNHIITISTIQLDFLLPERFNLEYIDKNGKKGRPVFIHAGIIGTFERYLSILLEQTNGALPLWLSPIQVLLIPINDRTHFEKTKKMQLELLKYNIRAKIDNSDERLSKKIRNAQVNKIPYVVVLGDNELNSNTVTYRCYGKTNEVNVSFKQFLNKICKDIKDKK